MKTKQAPRSQQPARGPAPAPVGERRACSWPGCPGDGSYRAPISRHALQTYHWFCLEHVRCYNAAWNYYAGMSEAQVEADVRDDTVWRRPTWRMGGNTGPGGIDPRKLEEGLDGLDGLDYDSSGPSERRWQNHSPEGEAMAILDLRPPVTEATLKARYKELVKRHHPDANGGDKGSEEKFKQISHAYHTIIEALAS